MCLQILLVQLSYSRPVLSYILLVSGKSISSNILISTDQTVQYDVQSIAFPFSRYSADFPPPALCIHKIHLPVNSKGVDNT